jgi:hypothetical protein
MTVICTLRPKKSTHGETDACLLGSLCLGLLYEWEVPESPLATRRRWEHVTCHLPRCGQRPLAACVIAPEHGSDERAGSPRNLV